MREILIRPLITEKMTSISEKQNKFGFFVDRAANKIEIKKAVEKAYGVSVLAVNTMNYDGKTKSRFSKTGVITGRGKGYKKAIVKLKAGDTIDFYATV